MNLTSMHELCNRYLDDSQFREQMRQDPVGTAQSTGLAFDDEDRESIRNWDWGPSGEEVLRERTSKGLELAPIGGQLFAHGISQRD
jgi:hypothetical protein